jgi:hypothetical protein
MQLVPLQHETDPAPPGHNLHGGDNPHDGNGVLAYGGAPGER